jgi:hypothetical protein
VKRSSTRIRPLMSPGPVRLPCYFADQVDSSDVERQEETAVALAA